VIANGNIRVKIDLFEGDKKVATEEKGSRKKTGSSTSEGKKAVQKKKDTGKKAAQKKEKKPAGTAARRSPGAADLLGTGLAVGLGIARQALQRTGSCYSGSALQPDFTRMSMRPGVVDQTPDLALIGQRPGPWQTRSRWTRSSNRGDEILAEGNLDGWVIRNLLGPACRSK